MKTITHPTNPEKTYTYGTRGRKPKWVLDYEKEYPQDIPEKKESPVYVKKDKDVEFWQWSYLSYQGYQCLIVARNEIDAIMMGNKCFRWPLSIEELSGQWKKTEYEGDLEEGVWEFKDDTWQPRSEIFS